MLLRKETKLSTKKYRINICHCYEFRIFKTNSTFYLMAKKDTSKTSNNSVKRSNNTGGNSQSGSKGKAQANGKTSQNENFKGTNRPPKKK